MKRSVPLRRSPSSFSTSAAVIRPRRCDPRKGGCGSQFTPLKPMQKACGFDCAARMGAYKNAKIAERAAKLEAAATRKAKESAKTLPVLKAEAQEAFNEWVRLRDAGKGCFVCGTPLVLGGVGGGFDAGHIRARSQADHLRYDERNVHGQCKACNAPGATKDHVMREAAARLLGQGAAEALYADNRVHKWQRDEVRQIRDTYRAKARALKKERA